MSYFEEFRAQRLGRAVSTPVANTPPALGRAEVGKVFYPEVGGAEYLSDQPFLSYQGRIKNAKLNDDHLEAARLEAEAREVREFSEELKLNNRQALKIVNAVWDTTLRPLSRTEMLPVDQLNVQKKFGPQAGKIVQSAGAHVGKLLANKPTLVETVRRGKTVYHPDAVDVVCEAVQALGLVKPIT